MKFVNFYGDLIFEAKDYSDEKFDWITKNIGDWLYNELFNKPSAIHSMHGFDDFKIFLRYKTTEKPRNDADYLLSLHWMEQFLNYLPPKYSREIIKKLMKDYPNIAQKINRYGKPETSGKRGRPVGSKNKPRPVDLDFDIEITPKKTPDPTIPQQQPTVSEPKKRGRKPVESQFTAQERFLFKKEGPEKIQKMEAKVAELDKEVDQTVQKIKKLMQDIERRKSFFGTE